MASTCELYKGSIRLGAGSCAAASASITSWVVQAGYSGKPVLQRNVTIAVTEAGTHVGRTWRARVIADNGSGTLTLSEPCPFVGA